MKKWKTMVISAVLLTLALSGTLTSVNAQSQGDQTEQKDVIKVNENSLVLSDGGIMPLGATAQTTFGYGLTKTTLTLRDSYNIPVKVEVWVERSTLTGANVKITKFKLLSYSGALISNVTERLDTSKMNPGNGKTATATLYISYSIGGIVSSQTIFGLDVTTGGTGKYYVT